MTDDSDIIILRRDPGPVAGTTAVTVDAPGFTQAVFVIDDSIKDSIEEKVIIKKMITTRLNASAAARTAQI